VQVLAQPRLDGTERPTVEALNEPTDRAKSLLEGEPRVALAELGRVRQTDVPARHPDRRDASGSGGQPAGRQDRVQQGQPEGSKEGRGSEAAFDPLEDRRKGHELPRVILDWRQFSKLKGTYTDNLVMAVDERTHRVHTSFQLAASSTGRLASSDPNLQNIPVRTEEGRKIRQAFMADPGHVLLDHTQHRAGGYRGVDGVTAGAQYVDRGETRQRVRGRRHAVAGDHRRTSGQLEVA
jgi:hypothetical protein